ncbi:acyltransferase family protein [Bacillus lacus]|uniref:Acyltransferase family protein n=1 Tax=Metabacillus lacus TaxID=1983721 RepID=A0A7X2J107_9BACI|nr:acyltransferase family protein [Metabacillus lacus]MRX73299.1 acyltransferase family protein [Metabacillus lacus]
MKKTRDSYFDNAKFLLILLVVFGHFIRSFINDNELIMTIYKYIYTFHMPAFILLAGFFAKGFNKKGYVAKITKKLILPYLIFQGIYSVYYYLIQSKDTLYRDPLNPHWSLWFLLSLFSWNILLFVFTKFPKKVSVTIAFGIGIAVGYAEFISSYLSLSRTFVFFPLFLLGYYLRGEHFKRLSAPSAKKLAGGILAAAFIAYLFIDFHFEWLFGSKPYAAFGEADVWSGLTRLGFYVLTILLTFAFMAFVPRREFFFTKWGTRTFYVYLLHGFVIGYFRQSQLAGWLKEYQSLTLIVFMAVALTFILSSTMVKTMTQPIIELKTTTFRNMLKAVGKKEIYR